MKKKYKRLSFILIMTFISFLGLYLILKNFNDNIIFFFTPSELKEKKIDNNKIIRIGGLVKENSLKKNDLNIEFVITDYNNEILVKYKGTTPNLFKEGQGTVAKGFMLENYFLAHELLAKHDEKYMPKEVINAIKNSGQWKP